MQLDEWRALQATGEEAVLPSGLEIRIRRVGVLDLAEQGRVPQSLAPQINSMMKDGKVRNASLSDLKNHAELVNIVCQAAIVAPAGLLASELPFTDRLALFNWANEVGQKLETFRQPQAQPLGSAPNGQVLRAAAE